ncbi:1240_t:CDS:2, partial [Entrophospora sp. SA101]
MDLEVAQEAQAALSEVISEKIWDELSEVEFFGVIIDEFIDITTTKHLNVYITYVPAIKTTIQLINSEYIDAPQGLVTAMKALNPS